MSVECRVCEMDLRGAPSEGCTEPDCPAKRQPAPAAEDERTYRYFLKGDYPGANEVEVSKDDWVRYERRAGFRDGPLGEPATGGFTGYGVQGFIRPASAEAGRAEGQEGDGYLEVPPPKVRGYMTAIPRGELARLRAAEADRDRLKAALRKYGLHTGRCRPQTWTDPCTCGLTAALNGQEAKHGG